MISTAMFIIFVAILAATFIGTTRKGIKNAVLVSIFLALMHVLFFAAGSVRTHADIAKKQGKPFAFVEGLARMHSEMVPVRLKTGIGVLGIFIIALTCINRKKS